MNTSTRLIGMGLLLAAALGLAGLIGPRADAQAQRKPTGTARPAKALRSTPTPTPTPAITTATLMNAVYDPTNGTTSSGDVYRLKQGAAPSAAPKPAPGTEMVPFDRVRSPLPKPMFVGTPTVIRSPNLESQSARSYSPPPATMYHYGSPVPVPPQPQYNTESFGKFAENPFAQVAQEPRSTFSIDVDTAAYAIVRTMLNEGRVPPKGAVRIEELVNYFSYNYPQPRNGVPFSVNLELAQCPWAPRHKLARIGLKGREIRPERRPSSNLVFLLDVSGSMADENKLPLVKRSMLMLLDGLDERDRVSIVVYASESGIRLEPTACDSRGKQFIRQAITGLEAGGSTQGSAGLQLAYELAGRNFVKGGVNRVILCTDGDFNVGLTTESELHSLIARKAKSGVFLTVLGFGMGNLQDSKMQTLADRGNGNYGYIDTLSEARKLLDESLSGTLITIAKDVKIQVEFNPVEVAAFRLLGYENRMLAQQDFNNDRKDAGEIGAGHTVTALYEIVPAGESLEGMGTVDPLKYQVPPVKPSVAAASGELMTVNLRYKDPNVKGSDPEGQNSKLLSAVLRNENRPFAQASEDFRFAAAVASFGMILRDSPNTGQASMDAVINMALDAKGRDENSTRAEFVSLARLAKNIRQPERDF